MEQEKIREINEDLILVRGLNKGMLQRRNNPTHSVKQLGNLVKSRNQKYNYSKEQKQKTYNEMRNWNYGDTKSLEQKIRIKKQQQDEAKQNKRVESDCIFYVGEIKLANQEEYLSRYMEYSVFNMVQTAMTNKHRKDFTRKLISSVRATKKNKSTFTNVIIPTSHSRSNNKKNQYLRLIQEYVRNKNMANNKMDLPKMLTQQFSGSKVWKIVYQHLKQAENTNNIRSSIKLIVGSIQMVQKEFEKVLYGRIQDRQALKQYLRTNYLQRRNRDKNDNQAKIEYERDLFWGIAFVYYRAGLKEQFYKCLSERKLIQIQKEFKLYDGYVQKYLPEKFSNFWTDNTNNDIFFLQLMFILKGSSKYSSSVLCEPTKLDMVWLMLRTLGLYIGYAQQKEKFEGIRQSLLTQYLQDNVDQQVVVINMLYLLGYSELAQMGPTNYSEMDIDDYLHLLLVLVKNPVLVNGKVQRIQILLKDKLVSFIHELIIQKKEQYLSYLLLIPQRLIVAEGSNIIASSQLLQEIDWNFVEKGLTPQTSKNLLEATLVKYIQFKKKYLFAAKKYWILLKKPFKAVETIMKMLCSSICEIKFHNEELQTAENLATKIYNQNPREIGEIWNVICLLIETRKITKCVFERKLTQAIDIINKSPFIVRKKVQSKQFRRALDILIENHYLEVYFYFLESAIRAVDNVKLNSSNEFETNGADLIESISLILGRECSIPYANKKVVLNLVNYISNNIHQQ